MTLSARVQKSRTNDVDMTTGSVFSHLLQFSLPLLAGNVFQQFYNTVDAWVVGNYVSNEAFSAVGTISPVVNLLIGFFTGLATGAGVVISQYYGARKLDRVHNAVHTSVMMTLLMGVLFTAAGIAMTPAALRMMKVPDEVFPEAKTYLTIYFAGVIGLMLYNMGAGILRAVGDSQHPFFYLVACALMNTVLDLVFVLGFRMGVAGVAYATILAQFISAVLVFRTLLRTKMCVRVTPSHLKLHWDELKRIIDVGIPSAIQIAVTSFSNIFVQSYINFFGADCMSGWAAYVKVDAILLLPNQTLQLAITTFVGQNLGTGNEKRARKGVRVAILMSIVSTFSLLLFAWPFAGQIVGFFNHKPAVMEYGKTFVRWIAPCYAFCCVNQVLAGTLRGAGHSRACMITMLGSFVVFRQIYLFIMANYISNTFLPIAMGYPAGWFMAALTTWLYYRKADFSQNRVLGKL